jgi:hypothetical protein
MDRMATDFQYDVAVSFAGEDRKVAERFADLLETHGLTVFYDDWNAAELWGRDLYQHLDEVYSRTARFVVVFTSAAYSAKAWPSHELKSAQARAFEEKREYILPVRLDDTAIPGIRSTVGFLDLRKLSVEQIAALTVEKVTAFRRANGSTAPSSDASARGAGKAAIKKSAPVIDGSGDWLLLADAFYQARSVERPDAKRFNLKLVTDDAASDAQLEALRSSSSSGTQQVSFAYANDAFVVRCESMASTYEAGASTWRLVLLKEDIGYGGDFSEVSYRDDARYYSADDIARMRAERILLGTPAALSADRNSGRGLSSSVLESFVQGSGTPLKVTESPIRELGKKIPRTDSALFMTFARLLSLYYLKAGGVVERIERLALGPLKPESVHVVFRGLRRQKYQNVDAVVIDVQGDCPLPK